MFIVVTVPRDLVSIRGLVPVMLGTGLCQLESCSFPPSLLCELVFCCKFCYFIWQMNPSFMALGEKEAAPIVPLSYSMERD